MASAASTARPAAGPGQQGTLRDATQTTLPADAGQPTPKSGHSSGTARASARPDAQAAAGLGQQPTMRPVALLRALARALTTQMTTTSTPEEARVDRNIHNSCK